MNAKKRLSLMANSAAAVLFAAANAHAASTTKVFVSKLSVILFLGFCAFLLVVQLIPAAMTLIGMIKGAAKDSERTPARAKAK